MADHTDIEWTDATWNPITGCRVVSPGCTNCYAMALAGTRLKNHESRAGLTKQVNGNHVWTGEVRFNAEWLDQPLRWTKPRMIFVCAHGDLFAEGVPDEWLDQIFAVMALAPQHTFQVLTKRPERMREYLRGERDRRVASRVTDYPIRDKAMMQRMLREIDDAWPVIPEGDPEWPDGLRIRHWPLPNVWLGVSVEDQRRADERIPILLDTPAAIRWISAEPLLGPVELTEIARSPRAFDRAMPGFDDVASFWTDALSGSDGLTMKNGVSYHTGGRLSAPGVMNGRAISLDWVVAGGESGPDARPMHPDWARGLRDQCAAAGVPFLFKQWGEWLPGQNDVYPQWDGRMVAHHQDGTWGPLCPKVITTENYVTWEADGTVHRGARTSFKPVHRWASKVGKRRAGRLLDGIEHNAFPEIRR